MKSQSICIDEDTHQTLLDIQEDCIDATGRKSTGAKIVAAAIKHYRNSGQWQQDMDILTGKNKVARG